LLESILDGLIDQRGLLAGKRGIERGHRPLRRGVTDLVKVLLGQLLDEGLAYILAQGNTSPGGGGFHLPEELVGEFDRGLQAPILPYLRASAI
jgi:hypothetical protein